MKQKLCLLIVSFISLIMLSSHDMFLKFKTYFLKPGTETSMYLYNGTFDKSENVIDRDRLQDVSLINPWEKLVHPANTQWSEENNQTVLKFKTGKEGTGVVALSTKTKILELSAADFEEYLKHDGILDIYDARKKSGENTKPAKEKYSKHVKAIFQTGSQRSDDYKSNLGYPVEFIPQSNPYSLKKGDEFSVLLLKNSKPLVNELVYASYTGYHGHAEDGSHLEAVKTRSDAKGMVKIKLSHAGQWYLRTINMVKSVEQGVDYESNWATITFEIK